VDKYWSLQLIRQLEEEFEKGVKFGKESVARVAALHALDQDRVSAHQALISVEQQQVSALQAAIDAEQALVATELERAYGELGPNRQDLTEKEVIAHEIMRIADIKQVRAMLTLAQDVRQMRLDAAKRRVAELERRMTELERLQQQE
jgi:hypothetical protein